MISLPFGDETLLEEKSQIFVFLLSKIHIVKDYKHGSKHVRLPTQGLSSP